MNPRLFAKLIQSITSWKTTTSYGLFFTDLNFNSIETLPGFDARAAFTVNSATVFREDVNIVPTIVDDTLSYVPWGGDDNQMPFYLLALVKKNETLATCQCFNAEEE